MKAQMPLMVLVRTYPSPVIGLAFVSGLVNILYLTGSFFMLEVYDRVIPSRSMPTLVGLMVLAAGLFVLQGCRRNYTPQRVRAQDADRREGRSVPLADAP